MNPFRRSLARASVTAVLALAVSACGFTGVNDTALPFTKGAGDGAMTITVMMTTAGNLTPNSEVKIADVTVGSVRRITFDNWTAKLEVGVDPGAQLPANAVARVGQKSLLGAQYLELAPPSGIPAQGLLQDGAVVPIDSTSVAPDTEQILTAAGTVLNGGGLDKIGTITRELNLALGGKEGAWRDLIASLDTFVARVNDQRGDLVKLIDATGRLGGRLAAERATLQRALDAIPQGLAVLGNERETATVALRQLAEFGTSATALIRSSQEDLTGNVRDLATALDGVADAGTDLPKSLGLATFPLPVDTAAKVVRGDYANLDLYLDLTNQALDTNFLSGTPLAGLLTGVNKVPPSAPSTQGANPLTAPLEAPTPTPSATPSSPQPVKPTEVPPAGGLLGSLVGLLGGGR